ncbi:hypothetical protein [Azospirillum sp. sgz302134]
MSQPDRGASRFWHTLTVVAVAAGIGGAGGYAASMRRIDQLEGEFAVRPRIAVVDFQPIIEGAAVGATAEQVDRAAVDLRAKVHRLAGAGFIVLDAAAVHGMPPGFIIPVDGMFPTARPASVAAPPAGPPSPAQSAAPAALSPASNAPTDGAALLQSMGLASPAGLRPERLR